jgi:hypothetical protein
MSTKKWSAPLSIKLTSVIIKVLFAVLTVSLVAAPYIAKNYFYFIMLYKNLYVPFLVTFYVCAVFAYIALFYLNKIIKNIKSEVIFVMDNVKYMRILSWCCFFVSIATLIYGWFMYYFLVISAAAAFFGLILRVLKNVFEEAVKIREENDFTI